jgi:hypothetical protein
MRPVAATAAIIGLALWTGLAAREAYAARYAFQDEYTFAREVLAQLPPGCAVYQVQIRDEILPGDVDCCLDLRRSPLPLDFPALRFLYLPENDAPLTPPSNCIAYYESIACEIMPGRPDQSTYAFATIASTHFQERCAVARRRGRLELLAETTTSPRTTRGLFAEQPPHARLYRWTP